MKVSSSGAGLPDNTKYRWYTIGLKVFQMQHYLFEKPGDEELLHLEVPLPISISSLLQIPGACVAPGTDEPGPGQEGEAASLAILHQHEKGAHLDHLAAYNTIIISSTYMELPYLLN